VPPDELRAYVASYLRDVRNAKGRATAQPSPRRRSPLGPSVASAHEDKEAQAPEIALYGGTFTNLPLPLQERYLAVGVELKREGLVSGIRLSTRPDALGREQIALLRRYGVGTVEVGAQSLNDEVLALAERGHTAADVVRAARAIQGAGMRLGVQLMPGLPGSTLERELDTARRVVRMEPAFVRLYPTVVLRGTRLAQWFRRGRYSPLSLEQAVSWCARILEAFEEASIPVIRVGLQPTPLLDRPESVLAGPYHPALGALVRSRLRLERISSLLAPGPAYARDLTLVIPPAEEPLFRGQRNANIVALRERYGVQGVCFARDRALAPGSFAVVVDGETRWWNAPQR